MIRRYLSWVLVRWAARAAWRVGRVVVTAALILGAAPVSLVAAGAVTAAWRRGWPPRRLLLAAAGCGPMVVVWLAWIASTRTVTAVLTAPSDALLGMWHYGARGQYPLAAAVVAPAAIPLGLAAGGLIWARRIAVMASGSGGRSPGSAAAFDRRQWRHQVRSARARIAAPGSVPLTRTNGAVVAGAVIRAVNHPAVAIASIPYARMRSHQVVVGTSGTGKTTLLLRLWAGFMATALQRHAAGQGRPPLLVVLDCKGGADARRIADRARRVLRASGARSTAVWPDEASLSLWDLPPRQLTTTLIDLVEHGTGAAAYYADVMEALVALAVEAPGGPPTSSADFVARLDPGWLTLAYSGGGRDAELALIRSAGRQSGDVVLRYRTLFRRIGGGLDGPGGFGDADAWYCILEGTAEVSVAESQARALVDLLAHYAAGGGPGSGGPVNGADGRAGGGQGREILLAVDEFSAVARRLPIWGLYERARSLGLAVQVSAQSWPGLAADEDERYRIAAAADGGIWLLRTPHPEPVTGLAGERKLTDTSRRLRRTGVWNSEGTSRVQLVPVADPDLIRSLDVGQAAYIYRGGVTFVQVKRIVGGPAALTATPAPRSEDAAAAGIQGAGSQALAAQGGVTRGPATHPGRPAVPGRPALPDVSGLLDEAFGAEAAP